MENIEKGIPIPASMVRKVVIASVLGNAFEWFDFAIYGLFTVIISKLYFPTGDEVVSILLALGTFGVAFAVRPLGGLLLGMYGDRVGRKKALSLTIGLMALGTGLIGVIPTYQAIGIAAPILVLIARLIQGFSAGGEFGGATTMLIEFAPAGRRGLFGSVQMCSQALAFSLAALVAYLLTSNLSPEQLNSWGWRLPFLFGVLIGPIGWLIRSRIDESPEFLAFAKSKVKAVSTPVREVFKLYPRQLFSNFCLVVVGTVSAYVFVFYLPIFAKKQLGMATTDVNLSTFISTFIVLVLCPVAGHLSDRYTRKAVLAPAILLYGVVAYFMFIWLLADPTFTHLVITQAFISASMSFFWGPTPVSLIESFPVGIRSTGASISYNLAVLIFGGMAPFVNTWLVKVTGNSAAPIYYVELSVLIGLIGMMAMPSSKQKSLSHPITV